jgi:glycerol-3-phosphate acyltransferase PlsY
MDSLTVIAFCVISYLLGSIPTAVWFGKAYFGIDIRSQGSGNAGATNTLRTLGKKAGLFVLIVDFMKGFSAANLMMLQNHLSNSDLMQREMYITFQLLFGACAAAGHIYPVFANFKGGKGIATMIGVVLAVDYELALLLILTFIVVVAITQYVSMASMLAACLSPVYVYLLFRNSKFTQQPNFILFCMGFATVVLITHRKNIVRLFHGNENKTRLFKIKGRQK